MNYRISNTTIIIIIRISFVESLLGAFLKDATTYFDAECWSKSLVLLRINLVASTY